jgi:hypothetical protein
MPTNLIQAPQALQLNLYAIEDNLAALANSFELIADDETRQLILDEIGQALRQAKDKRDAVVGFLRHCEAQQRFADKEIERIKSRRDRIAQFQTEFEQYIVRMIEEFAVPDRRGIKRLEGNFSSMRIQKNPESVVITDEKALPVAWKDVILTMPAHVWEGLLQRLDKSERAFFEARLKKTEFKSDKRLLANELKNGAQIPRVDLKFGDFRLVIA